MKNKKLSHTRGPWKIDRAGLCGGDDGITAVHGGELWTIARVASCESLKNTANAELIAAAPELLAALEACQKEIEALYNVGRTAIDTRPECDWNRMVKVDDMARAAIAKAKGE